MHIAQSRPSAKSNYPNGIRLNLRPLPRLRILLPSSPPIMHKQIALIVKQTVKAHRMKSEIMRMQNKISKSLPSSFYSSVRSSYRVNPLTIQLYKAIKTPKKTLTTRKMTWGAPAAIGIMNTRLMNMKKPIIIRHKSAIHVQSRWDAGDLGSSAFTIAKSTTIAMSLTT